MIFPVSGQDVEQLRFFFLSQVSLRNSFSTRSDYRTTSRGSPRWHFIFANCLLKIRAKLRFLPCMIKNLPRDPCSSFKFITFFPNALFTFLHPDPIGFLLEFPDSLGPKWRGCMKGSKVYTQTPQSACDPPPPPPPTHTLDYIRGSMTAERGYWGIVLEIFPEKA